MLDPHAPNAVGSLLEQLAVAGLAGGEFALGARALGDVLDGSEHPLRSTLPIERRLAAYRQDSLLAVRADNPILDVVWPASVQRVIDRPLDHPAIVRMHPAEEPLVIGGEPLRSLANDPVHLV